MVYLNNAATSYPKPEAVLLRVNGVLREPPASEGRSNKADSRNRARRTIASFFGGSADRLIFTSGATEGLNVALQGLLQPGDHVVTTETEHTSVLRPLRLLEERIGIRWTPVPCDAEGYVNPRAVTAACTADTRMVVLNHGSNVTGAVQDLETIGAFCRKNGILFVVDASQTAGHVPIDMAAMQIDVLVFTGHKGLLGIEGCGGFCFAEGITIRPLKVGGTGVRSDMLEQPAELPHLLEAGTLNRAGIESMAAGIEYLSGSGDSDMRRTLALRDRVVDELLAMGRPVVYAARRAGRYGPLLSFNIPGLSPADAGDMLGMSFDIAVRSGLHCAPLIHRRVGSYPEGSVRASFGRFNTEEDADRLLDALKSMVASVA